MDFEGTYPLPEAQLDRFLVKIRVQYPEANEEVQLLSNVQNGFDSHDLASTGLNPIDPELLKQARQEVRTIKVQESLFDYVVQLVRRTRDGPHFLWEPAPARP